MSAGANSIERLQARFALTVKWGLNLCLRFCRNILFLRRTPPDQPECIVVHLIGNVGDTAVAIPALIALRERYPGSRLILFTSAGYRREGLSGASELLEGVSFLDGIEVYTRDDARHPKSAWHLLRRLRRLHPDLIVSLPPCNIPLGSVIRNLFFACFAGARFGVGFELVTLQLFSFEQAQLIGLYPSEITRNLGHLRELGVIAPDVRFEFGPVKEQEMKRIAELASNYHPFVALCPGGRQTGHRWSVERFIKVANYLRNERGLRLVTVGSAKERELCCTVLNAVGGGINLAGELSLRGNTELLSKALFLLTNDTGPMHLAALTGTPVVAIFGTRDLAGRWYPYGEGHEVFRTVMACEQCLFDSEASDHCVNKIEVGEVLAGCQRVLERVGYTKKSMTSVEVSFDEEQNRSHEEDQHNGLRDQLCTSVPSRLSS